MQTNAYVEEGAHLMRSTGSTPLRGLPRALAVWCGLTLTAASLGWLALPELAALVSGRPRASFDDWLRLGAALAAAACAAWGWTVGTLVVLGVVRGVAVAPRGCPAGLLRLLLAGLGVGLALGLTGPAYAGDHGPGTRSRPPEKAGATALSLLEGLPLPDRASSRPVDHAPSAPRSHPVPRTHPVPWSVVVVPGDTLWALAAAGLPDDASDARVAARCRQLYALNRAVIGPDPDHITVGLRLRVPGDPPDPR